MPEFWQVILSSVVVSGAISAIVTGCINWYSKKSQKCFEKRLEVLERLYEYLADMNMKMLYYLSPLQMDDAPKEEARTSVEKSYRRLAHYFYKKKIFLDAEMASKIDNYLREVKKNYGDHQYALGLQVDDFNIAIKTWDKYRTGIIPEMETSLEERFRKSLGMHPWERHLKKAEPKKKTKK